MSSNEEQSPNYIATMSSPMEVVDKKNSHSEIEKRRRDKMNQCINELSTMIPLPPSVGKKPDKLTVLKFAVQHMKVLKGSTEPLKETDHKPSFVSDDDLRNLITEASGGFIIVVECDRGQVLYVTDSVEGILNISQDDMVGFNFYELVHSKDVSMVKTQLFTTVSDSKEEKSDPQKVPLLNELIENSGDLCPGAKRSFLCHMKKGGKPEDKIGMGTKTSLRKSKPDVLLNEGESVLISYEGYLKSWPPKKEAKSSNDPNSRSCLVAVGRVMEIDKEQTDYSKLGQICEFETRQRADATFVRIDKSFTKICGYCSDEVVGKSAYDFFHKDDLKIVAEAHYKALNNKCSSRPEVLYRFRTKAGHYIPLKTKSVVLRNPWSKEVDYLVTKNVVISAVSFNTQRGTEEMTSNDSTEQHEEMSENLRNLLAKLENQENNETKSQRKRGLNTSSSKSGDSPKIASPADIGVMLAEEAKKMGHQLRISSQSAKYSNVDRPKESEQTVSNSSSSPPRGGHALDNYRQNNVEGTDDIQSENEEQSDGIMIEQLAGIQGAIDAMENTEVNDDEDSLSLLMNVLESDDLSTVLNDMPWNLM